MNSTTGYYSVKTEANDTVSIYTVYASSDYAAAVKVRKITGFMPKSELDVAFIAQHRHMETSHTL